MLLTKASEYALLSLTLISQKDTPQDVDTLSTQLNISKSFLAKILQSLAKEGILKSYKGAKGGFILAVSPEKLSIKSIIECAEKKPTTVFDCSISSESCPNKKAEFCKIWPMLNNLQMRINEVLENLSLRDILEKEG